MEDTAASDAGNPAVPVTTPPPKVTTDMTIAPGVVISVATDAAAAGASPEFRTFIAEAKISGIRSGPNAIAFINGRLVRAGQPVDNGLSLSITFVGADVDTHLLTFKDRAGMTVTRRF